MGTGTGSADDALNEKLKMCDAKFWNGKRNYTLSEKNYNYHNAYLQHFATAGVIGFLIFVLLTYLSQNTFALDTVAVKQLYPGVTYYHITSAEPLSIHLLETDLSNNAIKLELEIANGGLNRGGETTSSAAKRRLDEGKRVIAAVNCDFFGGPGIVFLKHHQ